MSLLLFTSAWAGQPLDAVKGPVEKILNILKDPQYEDTGAHAELRRKIWEITRPMFDFELIAKRTIGRYHWENSFSEPQRVEFVDLFAQFVGNTYLQRIQGNYADVKIEFGDQQISETRPIASVQSKIIRSNSEVSLDYRLRLRDGEWKIYDVFAEGVSLTQNYKTQFDNILMNETAAQLIDRLKEKIAEQEQNQEQNKASAE